MLHTEIQHCFKLHNKSKVHYSKKLKETKESEEEGEWEECELVKWNWFYVRNIAYIRHVESDVLI